MFLLINNLITKQFLQFWFGAGRDEPVESPAPSITYNGIILLPLYLNL